MLSAGHCPSADNPRTIANETDCFGNITVSASGGELKAQPGNLCHVDCADQGVCDYSTGVCDCFPGQGGLDCTKQVEVPMSSYDAEGGIYASEVEPGGGVGSLLLDSGGRGGVSEDTPDNIAFMS